MRATNRTPGLTICSELSGWLQIVKELETSEVIKLAASGIFKENIEAATAIASELAWRSPDQATLN